MELHFVVVVFFVVLAFGMAGETKKVVAGVKRRAEDAKGGEDGDKEDKEKEGRKRLHLMLAKESEQESLKAAETDIAARIQWEKAFRADIRLKVFERQEVIAKSRNAVTRFIVY